MLNDLRDLSTINKTAPEKSLKSKETSLVASFKAKLTAIIDCNHTEASIRSGISQTSRNKY
jgi:hypothetical protein